jgi:hypothetical protein
VLDTKVADKLVESHDFNQAARISIVGRKKF